MPKSIECTHRKNEEVNTHIKKTELQKSQQFVGQMKCC